MENTINASLNQSAMNASSAGIKLDELKVPFTVTTKEHNAVPVIYKCAVSVERDTKDDESIVKQDRAHYVAAFKAGMQKTARAMLDTCRVTYEAHRVLDAFEFEKFCQDIGLRSSSSSIRKFLAIGKVYPRLVNYAEQLPDSWTSIYLITQIPADAFEACLKKGIELKNIKGKELQAMLKQTKDISSFNNVLPFDKQNNGHSVAKVLLTKKIDDVDWRAIEKAMSEIQARLPIKFVVSNEFINVVEKRRLQRYTQAKKHYKGIEFTPEVWDLGDEANAVLSRHKTEGEEKAAA